MLFYVLGGGEWVVLIYMQFIFMISFTNIKKKQLEK